jgi:DNA-binding MarR family transcriptional regulator
MRKDIAMELPSINAAILSKFWIINNLLSKRVDNKLSIHGISYTEFLVLSYLHTQQEKQARRADLASHIGLSASGITRMLSPMEKIGLVQKEKNARDARVSLVKLTPAGERILSDAIISVNEVADSIFSTLALDDKQKIAEELANLTERKI